MNVSDRFRLIEARLQRLEAKMLDTDAATRYQSSIRQTARARRKEKTFIDENQLLDWIQNTMASGTRYSARQIADRFEYVNASMFAVWYLLPLVDRGVLKLELETRAKGGRPFKWYVKPEPEKHKLKIKRRKVK